MDLRKKLDHENSIGLIVKTAEKSFERILDAELRERCGLTSGQWKVIIVLSFQEGISQKEIADLTFVEGSTLVPILDKMEKQGFVSRKSDPNDRRNNKIFLTAKSKSAISEIVNCILDVRKIITDGISEKDLDVSRKVLRQMTKNANEFAEKKGKKVPLSLLKTN